MNVKGVAWIGLKTGSRRNFDDARRIFSAIFGRGPDAGAGIISTSSWVMVAYLKYTWLPQGMIQ